jgi:hypothetical protein
MIEFLNNINNSLELFFQSHPKYKQIILTNYNHDSDIYNEFLKYYNGDKSTDLYIEVIKSRYLIYIDKLRNI